jgi:hypothetical protein
LKLPLEDSKAETNKNYRKTGPYNKAVPPILFHIKYDGKVRKKHQAENKKQYPGFP